MHSALDQLQCSLCVHFVYKFKEGAHIIICDFIHAKTFGPPQKGLAYATFSQGCRRL